MADATGLDAQADRLIAEARALLQAVVRDMHVMRAEVRKWRHANG